MRIGKEILKQQAELYRRLRNTLRWLLGSLAGFDETERVPFAELPELERFILHRLTELDGQLRQAVSSYDWTGFYPALHHFCATDLSAFYFDVRKDAIYCDRPDTARRRAARTVLDVLHRTLCTWLAPVLAFTAEEAWVSRFGDAASVHLERFPTLPGEWHDADLGGRWGYIRSNRAAITEVLEAHRKAKIIGSSLEAAIDLKFPHVAGYAVDFGAEEWAELLIVSQVTVALGPHDIQFRRAAGTKCARCWKELAEVGSDTRHPTLCLRCADAVESGLVCGAVE